MIYVDNVMHVIDFCITNETTKKITSNPQIRIYI